MLTEKWTSTNRYLTQSYHNLPACVHLAQQFIFLYKALLFTGKVRPAHPTFNLILPDDKASSNQARTQGENGSLSAVISAQLVQNIADVSLDCTDSNVKLFGDCSIAVTLHDQFQNF